MKLTKRKGFNFFRSYYDVYNEFENDKQKVEFIDALLNRQFQGIKPEGMKGLSKFAYISQVNSIDTQVKGYEDKLISLNKGVPNYDPWQGVKEKVLTPTLQVQVQEEVQGKEKEEVKGEEVDSSGSNEPPTPPLKKFNFQNSLIDYGFKKELVTDWLKVRKTKRATNTETAFNGFINIVESSVRDKNEIMTTCVEKSWTSYKDDWYNNLNKENGGNKKTSGATSGGSRATSKVADSYE